MLRVDSTLSIFRLFECSGRGHYAGLSFSATTSVSDGQLRPSVSFTNTNAKAVRLEYGACAITLLAYRDASRTGSPAWDSSRRKAQDGIGYACPAYLATGRIEPGQTASPLEFSPTFRVAEMLGDSLPAARYYFKARIGLNWRNIEIPAGDAVVAR